MGEPSLFHAAFPDLYDESPTHPSDIHSRLEPARALADAKISFVVWAEDALNFAHFVPTVLFMMQIIVPDEEIDAACDILTLRLPYERKPTPHPDWMEYKYIDIDQPSCFPQAALLEWPAPTPDGITGEEVALHIVIHPQSYFSFDVGDPSRSLTLVPPLSLDNTGVRFPTLNAFIDSLSDTMLDPPLGYRHWKLTTRLQSYLSYLMYYSPQTRAFPRVLPNGDLEPGHRALLMSVKPENRQFLDGIVWGTPVGWVTQVLERRALLEQVGRIAEARRPLPENRPRRVW